MESKVRVRIAPSPTGIPHIGNTRTALFNWLFARKNGGKFIVRVEDTDRERLIPESLTAIFEILNWLGINHDEGPDKGGEYGPYTQSERLDIYKKYALKLIEKDHAYYCFCTSERLDQMRKDQERNHLPPRYDRHCRSLSNDDIKKNLDQKMPYVIRLKVPDEGKSEWDDLILGHISFENKVIDDQILLKSDGFPTYHLGVVVDDYLMKITHVLRGSEWTSSTPKHILLYEFFGWEKPLWGHLPVILGPDKAKLSKRHGANSALWYRDQGYLPEALLNAIALWGWVPKNGLELLTKEEMVNLFDLKDVTTTNPIFNPTKIDWFNGQYIRKTTPEELLKLLKPFLQEKVTPNDSSDGKVTPRGWQAERSEAMTPPRWHVEDDYLLKIIPLVQDRLVKLSDWKELTDFFFKAPQNYDEKLLLQGHEKNDVKDMLSKGVKLFSELQIPWIHEEWEKSIRQLADEQKWKHADVFQIYRAAISGKTATPPLFETMIVLGRQEVLDRIDNVLKNKLTGNEIIVLQNSL